MKTKANFSSSTFTIPISWVALPKAGRTITSFPLTTMANTQIIRYEKMTIFMATILLFAIAIVLYGAVLIVFWKGPWLRRHSKFAQDIAQAEEDQDSAAAAIDDADADDREPYSSTGRGGASLNHQLLFLPAESLPGSRAASAATSPVTSARNSLHLQRPQAARQISEVSHVSLSSRPRVGPRQTSEASHASLNRPQVSQRQVSESSYVSSLSRPHVGQRQTSTTSVTPSRRHRKKPEKPEKPEQPVLAEDIWDAAERARRVARANAAHAKDCAKANGSCMCVGKNIAGCNCGKGEAQRNSDPTSVNEVEDAPQQSSENAPARARAHVHFREEVSEVSAPDISERTESERGEVRDDCSMM